ncbi:DUF3024 family protein [Amycolatopsis cihanbeyliensis]|uniref:DUF3024 family protein n=1 Tax=Amycolatopsis cihanbeyliensis TaxID=1128664 RepID=A0A542DM97_AMYCI|nr:DUF3024 family protein [Amycolatopsis cihanbeyliensis]
MSPIPELQQRQIDRWCERRAPTDDRGDVRFETRRRGGRVTIVQRRPPWPYEPGADWTVEPIAQLRCTADCQWTLHWVDRHGKWHRLPETSPEYSPVPLLDDIERNLSGGHFGG